MTLMRSESGSYSPAEQTPTERAHERFKLISKAVLRSLEGPVDRWIPRLYRALLTQRAQLCSLPEAERRMLEEEIDTVVSVVRGWGDEAADGDEGFFSRGQEYVHAIEALFMLPEAKEAEPLEIRRLSLEALASVDPKRLRVERTETGTQVAFRANARAKWTRALVPELDGVYYKGGLPRILLKTALGATGPTLAAEIPMNDVDVLSARDENALGVLAEAARLGADADGVEFVESIDWQAVMPARDVNLNQVLFGKEGLVYTTNAEEAVRTGSLRIESKDRGLYGTETFFHDGVPLIKNRGMYRLFKFVAENKAVSFDQIPLNRQVDFGIYWLVLARKFATKPNGGELLNRLFELARRAGQVRDGEDDVYDVLRRVHGQFPFFEFNQAKQSEPDVLRWLGRKLSTMADRKFRITRGMRLAQTFERRPGDTVPERVSLEGYAGDVARDAQVANDWDAFVEERETARLAYARGGEAELRKAS